MHLYGVWKNGIDEPICRAGMEMQTQRMDRGTRGKEGWDEWESSIDIYTVSCVKKTGEGNGSPFQDSCLENPMDGGAWQARVHGVAKSRTRLSAYAFTFHV